MKQPKESMHEFDANGNPDGGFYKSKGINIRWQKGPLGRGDTRLEPNGAFVENVIDAAIGRLKHYQLSKFACRENELALEHLQAAAELMANRNKAREKRQVEGTHEL